MVGVVILVVALLGGVGAYIGDKKGRPGVGLILGLLFGPLGWLIVAFLEPTPSAQARRNAEVAEAERAYGHASPVSQAPSVDRYAQLERLHNLLTAGAITQAEYDTEKAKLLG